jgi:hypothetical protein
LFCGFEGETKEEGAGILRIGGTLCLLGRPLLTEFLDLSELIEKSNEW